MYIVLLIFIAVAAGIVQLLGARLEKRACRYIKFSYALSLFISALVLFLFGIGECTNTGQYAALGLLLFNTLVGGLARYISLRRNKQECPKL